MSDAIEKTVAGATRGFFGALGFILLMLGLEGMTGAAGIQFGVGLFLALLGALCFYVAFFWETAKRVLSAEAQLGIGKFAQHHSTRLGLLLMVLLSLILSPFVERHRWPFSFPSDPQVYQDKSSLEQQLNDQKGKTSREKELADKWRFSKSLRDANAGECHYQLVGARGAQSTLSFWHELLRNGGWIGDGRGPINLDLIQPGITLRISGDVSACATILQRVLTDFYSNPPAKIAPNQQTNCGRDCVLIEMNY